ncbi:hypothetical protein [Nocardioides nematodiphilus]|uniref:hypothetical protein n=1 Tax=Nocardioides nematodiphilus TaxID=2849669 RepID=UPI001CDA0794|nr:hypothetical protein [Nocardioides nematodiphilus]MCA1982163.1 hypothetical protein [Nocardioides nematodiphilus]
MSWLALLLIGVGTADLVRSAGARALLPGGVGAIALVVLGLFAGLTSFADIAAMVVGVAVVLAWSLLSPHRPRSAISVLAGAVALAILFAAGASEAGGLVGDWLDDARLPLLHGVDADRALLVLGVLLTQLTTGNAIVRIVLTLTGSTPPGTGRSLKGGRLLGPMERLVILGLGLAGQTTAAGLVIAAKGLIRWPELQSFRGEEGPSIDEVTEYFLVGSFVSWLVALGSLVLLAT